MQILRSGLLWASHSRRIERFVRRSAAMKPLVRRFMPGEDLGAAVETARRLNAEGLGAVLSYLGENVRDTAAADESAAEYASMVADIATGGLDAQISVKLTQLGWDLDVPATRARLRALVTLAASRGIVVNIDMESSPYVEGTIDTFTELLAEYRNVGLCLQAYLRRTDADLDRLLPLHARLRLVKGAYREPAAVAFQEKSEIDARYLALARRMLVAAADGTEPSFGTHDLVLADRIVQTASALDVPTSAYDVQMLYGIQTDGLRALASRGVRARVFICYGGAWYPWFMRRLAERPANLVTALRNIF